MFLGDICSIEQHLNNDWTLILKNIKIREDCLYELLQYNKKVITKQRDEDELFINDEILVHQSELKKIIKIAEQLQQQQKQIVQKYEGSIISFEEIIKLMGRVGARIIQIYQSSIDKCKIFDDQLMQKYLKIKNNLIKLLNQKDKIHLEEITTLVINYTKNKLLNQIQRLQKLIVVLQNGEFYKLQDVYHPQPPKKVLLVNVQKKVSNDKIKVSSVGKTDKSPIKEQIMKQEKIKKEKQKMANKLVNLYSTMELSRQAFLDDICISFKEKSTRLYNEIFSRNKFNYEQIMAFEAKKQEFHQKVRMFKEMMQRQSKKIDEMIILKKKRQQIEYKQKNINILLNISMDQNLILKNTQQNDDQQQKIFSNRYRINSPKPKKDFKDNNQSYINNMNTTTTTQINFAHFKFDKQNNQTYLRSNRNKLPVIGHHFNASQVSRASSFDQRVQLNKNKIIREQLTEIKQKKELIILNGQEIMGEKMREVRFNKEEKYMVHRTKMPLKNIEVGVDGVVKKQSCELLQKQKKRFEPNPMQYTFYVRKSNNKFYQPKHNIIF